MKCRGRFLQDYLLSFRFVLCGAIALLVVGQIFAQQEEPTVLEEKAIRQAADRVSPSIVSIETLGGLERSGQVLFGSGPTTGLIVSEDGYIVSSAFQFASKPTSILVGLSDGTRTPAELVGTDYSRMLVLLKINVEDKLPVPEFLPETNIRVGQWALALGRAFDLRKSNLAVGIVSAKQRVWGKAIQTDAKISPNNYGGPLVDIHGRVMGVLVPLSPDRGGPLSGVDWYDSGIGFAIPGEQVQSAVAKLREKKDLHPGLMGIFLKAKDLYAEPPVIASSRPNSPAYNAGIKPGDKILAVDGRPVERAMQLMREVNYRYAGESVRLLVSREDKQLEISLDLVDHLEPYVRPFLGMLPRRDAAEGSTGVVVRFVYPDSGAAKAGLQAGDVIRRVAETEILSAEQLALSVAASAPGEKLSLEIQRGEATSRIEVVLGKELDELPQQVPPAKVPLALEGIERPTIGATVLKLPDEKGEAVLWVPRSYDPRRKHGMVVWFSPTGEVVEKQLEEWLGTRSETDDLLVLAPRGSDEGKWGPEDLQFAAKVLADTKLKYRIDPLRVVAFGEGMGGALAQSFAVSQRDSVRGVLAIHSPLTDIQIDNDPMYRLAFFLVTAKKSPQQKIVVEWVDKLRKNKYPIHILLQPNQPEALTPQQIDEQFDWLDALDKI